MSARSAIATAASYRSDRRKRFRESKDRLRVRAVKANRLLQMAQRLGGLPLCEQHAPEIGVSEAVVRARRERGAERRDRIVQTARVRQRGARD